MAILKEGKTNWKYIIIVLILAVIVSGGILWCYLKSPEVKFPLKPEKYSCNIDADCAIRRVGCSGCDFNLVCINKKWGHCELSPPSGESCLPPVPSPSWPRSCECINSKCVTKEVIGETADWKTYRNEEEKIELKYPKDWSELAYPIAKEKGLFSAGFSTDGTKTNMKNDKMKEKWAMVEITKIDRNQNQDIRDLFKDAPIEDQPQSSEIIIIDGVESMKALRIRYYDVVVFIPKDNYYYQISLLTTNPEFYEPIFNQMLSTFRFIEIEQNYSLIIDEVLPPNFDRENTDYFIDDLNGDSKSEIIITSVQSRNGYFTVVTLLDDEGNYEQIGDLEYEEAYRGVPKVKEVQDIDNDNQKEIFLNLTFGGASTTAEGILDLDFDDKRLEWVKFQDEHESIKKAIFYLGGSVMHQHYYTIEDLDEDGYKEIVKEDRWGEYKKPDKLEPWEKLVPMEDVEGMWWRYEIRVYEWNGTIFSYNEELSKGRLSMING